MRQEVASSDDTALRQEELWTDGLSRVGSPSWLVVVFLATTLSAMTLTALPEMLSGVLRSVSTARKSSCWYSASVSVALVSNTNVVTTLPFLTTHRAHHVNVVTTLPFLTTHRTRHVNVVITFTVIPNDMTSLTVADRRR